MRIDKYGAIDCEPGGEAGARCLFRAGAWTRTVSDILIIPRLARAALRHCRPLSAGRVGSDLLKRQAISSVTYSRADSDKACGQGKMR